MQFCVPGWNMLQKWKKKLSQHDIADYTAKRHQLVCWQASISVSWAVGGVCKVFACLLGSQLAGFGTELRIAALSNTNTDEFLANQEYQEYKELLSLSYYVFVSVKIKVI